MIGIVLGSASLFIVLSGFAGLRNFTLEFTTIIDPDLKVETTVGKSFILSKQQEEKLKSIKAIKSFSKIIEERVIATYDGNNHPAYIKGVDQNFNSITKIDSVIPIGNWMYPETPQSVVGWTISTHLSVGANDYGEAMTLSVPKPGKGQITSQNQAINQVKVVNVGIYDINEDINNKYIFTPLYIAKELLNYSDNQITSIEFDVDENANLEETKAQIQNILGKNTIVKDKDQLNDAIYKMLNTENLAVYLIFTLVLIIALFNIIGTIIMAILDKKQTLNTLYNLGASVKDIRNIFLYQGILMTLIGGVLGLIIGYILVQIQLSFKLVMITPTLPYPVALQLKNFIIVLITLMILGIIASKIASSRINRELVKTQ